MNRINTWLKRKLGKDAHYRVSVWELQKRGALHNHTVIASKDKEKLAKVDREFQSFCYQLFLDIGEKAEVDMFERSNGESWRNNPEVLRCKSEEIRKDVSRYMSKYMSKTNSKLNNNKIGKDQIYYPSVWASWGRGARELLNQKTVRIADITVKSEDANELANLCIIICGENHSEKYVTPLIYKDSYGGAVNIKMFLDEDKIESAISDIKAFLNCCSKEKSPEINTELPPFEMVIEKALEEAYSELRNQEIREKYGVVDSRLWQKAFRKNRAPLPEKENMEPWREYYAEHKKLLALLKDLKQLP